MIIRMKIFKGISSSNKEQLETLTKLQFQLKNENHEICSQIENFNAELSKLNTVNLLICLNLYFNIWTINIKTVI